MCDGELVGALPIYTMKLELLFHQGVCALFHIDAIVVVAVPTCRPLLIKLACS